MLKRKGSYINAFLLEKKYKFFEKIKAWALAKDKKTINSILGPKASPDFSAAFHGMLLVGINEWNASYRLSKKKEPTQFATLYDQVAKSSNKIPANEPPIPRQSAPPNPSASSQPNPTPSRNQENSTPIDKSDEVFLEFGT